MLKIIMPFRILLAGLLILLLSSGCILRRQGEAENRNETTIDRFIMTKTIDGSKPNRLIREKSPYLLQHAFNPVDWYSWGEEAFLKAREEEKPIFLSIGYSTCHWCHVMEHESFENDSVAAIMNRDFICIKVDREERPDIDRVYMTALQGMGQGGGWPMSMFLTPDLKPFFGGTYFPPETRPGRIGFRDLLLRISELWRDQRQRVLESANGITDFLMQTASGTGHPDLAPGVSDSCFGQISRSYDDEFGGFGAGPKFPRPVVFDFLLRYHLRNGNQKALEMTERTLIRMAEGGIHDHLGGGFHRYSVDGQWRVPHFEKMLYDQAQLAIAYLELAQVTGNQRFSYWAGDILDYVLRDMTDRNGGFYSAEDADSPLPEDQTRKGEGAFYLWTWDELRKVLDPGQAELCSLYYGIRETGNALQDPLQEFAGKNILYVAQTVSSLADQTRRPVAEVEGELSAIRAQLLTARNGRPRPQLDDKILTSWNGMMISAFARGYQILGDERYLSAAEKAARFLIDNLYDDTNEVLLHRFRQGEGGLEAHLEDYAFFAQALVDLYETTFDLEWLDRAITITQRMVDLFYDNAHGGFFNTSGLDSSVLVRMKDAYDGAEPAGNSVAALVLLRLSAMTDNDHWRMMTESIFSAFAQMLNSQPSVMPGMVVALEFHHHPIRQVLLVGPRSDPDIEEMIRTMNSRFIPDRIAMLVEEEGPESAVARYLPFVGQLTMIDHRPTAYVCEDYVCRLPTNDPGTFARLLDGHGGNHE